MKLYGPYEIEFKIYLTNGEDIAVASSSLPRSKNPTKENIDDLINESVDQIKEMMGNNWRPCSKTEYFDYWMEERHQTKQKFSMPGSLNWDEWE